MSPLGCQKMSAKPCNRNAEESFPVLSLKSREQKPPNPLLIQDKNVLQPRSDPIRQEAMDFLRCFFLGDAVRGLVRCCVCSSHAASSVRNSSWYMATGFSVR